MNNNPYFVEALRCCLCHLNLKMEVMVLVHGQSCIHVNYTVYKCLNT